MSINSQSFALVSFVLFFVCCEAARTLSSPGDNNRGVFDGSVGADVGLKNSAGFATPVGSLSVSHGANAAIEGGGGATTASNVIAPHAKGNLFNWSGGAGAGAAFQNGATLKTPIATIAASHGASAALGGNVGATTASNYITPDDNGKLFGFLADAGANAQLQNGARLKTPIGTVAASHGVNAGIGGAAGAASADNIVTPVGDEKILGVGWNAGAKAGIGGNAGITTPLGSIRAGVGAKAGANAAATGGIGGIPTATTP